MAAMRGLDAVVFTGGLGEKAFYVREKALNHLKFLGFELDEKKNKNSDTIISARSSKIHALVIECDEEKEIALETIKAINE